ncbi:hypothetical protein TURU_021179 [Turdus rufiventris]|nr:hypothetical protein TURU_021179 [Turdus rufiventris]
MGIPDGSPFGPGATSPGLHVWQVEQLQPVEVPKATLGIFFSRDSYLVLHNGLDDGHWGISLSIGMVGGWDVCPSIGVSLFPSWHLPGPDLMVWCGAWSNVLKHSRMQELAAASCDSERGGKAHLEIVADGEEPPEMGQVLGPKHPLQEGSPEEHVVADQSNTGAAVPYKARTINGTRAGHAKVSPWWAQEVAILPQGCETPFFKQFFTSWK